MKLDDECIDYRLRLVKFWKERGVTHRRQHKAMSAWKVAFMVREMAARNYRTVVEIGTRMGITAMTLGHALHSMAGPEEMGRVYSLDVANRGQSVALSEFDDAGGRVRFLIYKDKRTERFLEKQPGLQIDLLVIDGKHTAEAVRHDYETFGPKIRKGGMTVFDDAGPGRYPDAIEETPTDYVLSLDVMFFPDEASGVAYKIIGED